METVTGVRDGARAYVLDTFQQDPECWGCKGLQGALHSYDWSCLWGPLNQFLTRYGADMERPSMLKGSLMYMGSALVEVEGQQMALAEYKHRQTRRACAIDPMGGLWVRPNGKRTHLSEWVRVPDMAAHGVELTIWPTKVEW